MSIGTINEKAEFKLDNTAPVTGSDGFELQANESWTIGTGSREWNRPGARSYNIGAGGTQLIDLKLDLGADGVALNLVECRFLKLQVPDTALAGVTVEVDGTDGWTAWLSAITTTLTIDPGGTEGFTSPLAGTKLVGANDKRLLLTNLDGANAVVVEFRVAGVDA